MKKTILLFGVFLASFAFAQVSISGSSADTPEATLDVKAMKSTTSPDGILIPRLTRAETLAMNGTIQESTMIYVTDNNTTAGTGTVVDVDTKGFYYFDAAATPAPGKWVKVGGKPATLQGTKGNVKIQSLPVAVADWTANDFMIIANGGTGSFSLPDPASNGGRIVSVNNQTGSAKNFGTNPPLNFSGVEAGAGVLLISDGTNWYVVGGLF